MEPVKSSPPPPAPEPYSLKAEIGKGVEWVKFVWQMLRRLGGPVQILRTFGLILSMMMRRTLVQWGILRSR